MQYEEIQQDDAKYVLVGDAIIIITDLPSNVVVVVMLTDDQNYLVEYREGTSSSRQ